MDNFREELEQTIIGACLLENGYGKIAGILTHSSFSKVGQFDNQAIFKVLEEMYPKEPIDLLTVTHRLNLPYYAGYLVSCSSKVYSVANLRQHAFILLELNMSGALINLLTNSSQKESCLITKAAINDIIDKCLDRSNDILIIYEKVSPYLSNIGAQESLIAEVEDLKNHFIKRVSTIKKRAHLDALLQNLDGFKNDFYDVHSQLCLNHLASLFKELLVVKVSQAVTDRILRTNLND